MYHQATFHVPSPELGASLPELQHEHRAQHDVYMCLYVQAQFNFPNIWPACWTTTVDHQQQVIRPMNMMSSNIQAAPLQCMAPSCDLAHVAKCFQSNACTQVPLQFAFCNYRTMLPTSASECSTHVQQMSLFPRQVI